MKVHKSITIDRIIDAVNRYASNDAENPGFCMFCGAESDMCEPDARKYECSSCGAKEVYGAEELLFMLT